MDNIFSLHRDLKNGSYKHGGYHAFNISDPKPRNIHKASVCDRLVHHAVYRVLYPFFDRTFIADSYSCRVGKGTHKAMNRFVFFARKVSRNNTRTVCVLKCDIKKFFASIDHSILKEILRQYISDTEILALLSEIIGSFQSTGKGKGVPLGNLTSQLLVNIYMNEFDQYVKHRMKEEYYVRYADDFVFLSDNRDGLFRLIPTTQDFLQERLKLELHPNKLFLKTFSSGVDFLGWVHFPDHRVLRTATRRRMMKRIFKQPKDETVASYAGMLRYGNEFRLGEKVRNDKNLG
jgi:retron-type reverse transcriptase